MRIGLDVSPLDQTAAGTARYLESLARLDGVELVRLAHHGSSRAATVYRDAVWYPLVLPRSARRERLDVLHCPTFRSRRPPARSSLPFTILPFCATRRLSTCGRGITAACVSLGWRGRQGS